jgi:hypothetical protein
MRLPQIELSGSLLRPLADLQETLDVEGSLPGATATPTPCQRVLQEMPPDMIGRLLDLAGEERWRQRANRFALKVERRGVEQALYEWLLESLGFKGNRLPFWELARLAPIDRLRGVLPGPETTSLRIQAVLYGVSGLLRQWRATLKESSPESRAYVEALLSVWESLAHRFRNTSGNANGARPGFGRPTSPSAASPRRGTCSVA